MRLCKKYHIFLAIFFLFNATNLNYKSYINNTFFYYIYACFGQLRIKRARPIVPIFFNYTLHYTL